MVYIFTGVPGPVSAPESDTSSVQESPQLYEDNQAAEVPGGLHSGKGH